MSGTTVRSLTPQEQAVLRPLLQEIHQHAESCADCRAGAEKVETAAAFGPHAMCERGAMLYRRWVAWIAG